MKEALGKFKIIDLCRSYPPAFASAFLADFGAQVIKIDVPGFSVPIPAAGGPEAYSAFWFLDRNKKSLSLNLKSVEGRDIFLKLAGQSDVIIENSKPGTMERIGIGYPTIKELNPRIIYCSVSGFGQDGPFSLLPGHDSNYLAISGALSLLGHKDGPPIIPSNIIADMAGAAMHSLAAILIALLTREHTGEGQYIDISYTDAVFSLLAAQVAMHFLMGGTPTRGEHFLTGSAPFIANYKTKDGKYFNVACLEPWLWENLCREMNCPQFIPHQWTQDKKQVKRMFDFFKRKFLTKTRDEWWDWVRDKQIAAAPVLTIEEAMSNEQIRHRQMITNTNHPTLGQVIRLGSPLKLSKTPPLQEGFSPTPGQHTVDVMKDLGYDMQEINNLRERGVV